MLSVFECVACVAVHFLRVLWVAFQNGESYVEVGAKYEIKNYIEYTSLHDWSRHFGKKNHYNFQTLTSIQIVKLTPRSGSNFKAQK